MMDCQGPKRPSAWKSAFRLSSKYIEANSQGRKPSTKSDSTNTNSSMLAQRYGVPIRILSDEGAGGSILLVRGRQNSKTFAVKRFRRRHSIEEESDYARKIVAEYYVAASLRHQNIIPTLDLFQEQGQWLQVMEYAPYCLFDRVMSGRMSAEEISCAFMQILAGADHIHSSGFAHRDLKLENVVVTEKGIMKIIDFGSATTCKVQGSRSASGFIGCKPYMAPEILLNRPYDAQKADVWSLAIVYCCMVLGRFPWKSPDRSNEAFALFAAMESPKTPLSPSNPPSRASSTNSVTVINVIIGKDGEEKESITEKVLGPWGLLRQLPSQSRDAIRAMLSINPERRPTMTQVMEMPWIAQSRFCSEDADGKLHEVGDHQHVS